MTESSHYTYLKLAIDKNASLGLQQDREYKNKEGL